MFATLVPVRFPNYLGCKIKGETELKSQSVRYDDDIKDRSSKKITFIFQTRKRDKIFGSEKKVSQGPILQSLFTLGHDKLERLFHVGTKIS